jgi:hypothetical protein
MTVATQAPPETPAGTTPQPPWTAKGEALRAVALGVAAVVVLALAALLLVSFKQGASQAVVAISTAAFGVISAVVGAFFGMRVGAEQTEKLVNQNGDLANAAQAAEAKSNVYALYASHQSPPVPTVIHQEAMNAWAEVRRPRNSPG